jgi:hypothetical protein
MPKHHGITDSERKHVTLSARCHPGRPVSAMQSIPRRYGVTRQASCVCQVLQIEFWAADQLFPAWVRSGAGLRDAVFRNGVRFHSSSGSCPKC